MSKFKITLAFMLGAATGAAGAWFCLRETYTRRTEQDIASAKEAFHAREADLKEKIIELKARLTPDSANDEKKTVAANGKPPEKGAISDFVRAKYQEYSKMYTSPDTQTEKAPEGESPYVISPDEFGELEDYTQVSLIYYADGVLTDECNVVIEDSEEIVGDALNHFGEYEDDSVYCRSDLKRCDYEILKDLRRYADVAKTLPRNR